MVNTQHSTARQKQLDERHALAKRIVLTLIAVTTLVLSVTGAYMLFQLPAGPFVMGFQVLSIVINIAVILGMVLAAVETVDYALNKMSSKEQLKNLQDAEDFYRKNQEEYEALQADMPIEHRK